MAVPLSPRERQVIRGLAEGLTYQEIADRLGLQYQTVCGYVKRIRLKLGLRRRTEIAVWAVRAGLAAAVGESL